MLKARDPATVLKNGKTLKEMSEVYKARVDSNVKWSWVDDIAGGELLSGPEKTAIKDLAIRNGLIPDVPTIKVVVKGKTYTYADFEAADLVRKEVQLPEHLWKATDAEQFKWLDEKIGGRPAGTTWHHNEKEGIMQLVDFGIHNVTSHNGGRTLNHWSYRPGGR
jgi:hypothetical protein